MGDEVLELDAFELGCQRFDDEVAGVRLDAVRVGDLGGSFGGLLGVLGRLMNRGARASAGDEVQEELDVAFDLEQRDRGTDLVCARRVESQSAERRS